MLTGRGFPNHPLQSERLTSDKRHFTHPVIRRIKHKGLKRLHEQGNRSGVPPELADKLSRILARLDIAPRLQSMDLPGHRLHRLKGKLSGLRSLSVSGNWRVVFRFEGQDVVDVDLVDYH